MLMRQKTSVSGLECPAASCLGCAQSSTCPCKLNPQPALGALPSLSIDWRDGKTYIIIALVALVVYQTFFRKEQRVMRGVRRGELREAKDRYRADVKRIREAYA